MANNLIFQMFLFSFKAAPFSQIPRNYHMVYKVAFTIGNSFQSVVYAGDFPENV